MGGVRKERTFASDRCLETFSRVRKKKFRRRKGAGAFKKHTRHPSSLRLFPSSFPFVFSLPIFPSYFSFLFFPFFSFINENRPKQNAGGFLSFVLLSKFAGNPIFFPRDFFLSRAKWIRARPYGLRFPVSWDIRKKLFPRGGGSLFPRAIFSNALSGA